MVTMTAEQRYFVSRHTAESPKTLLHSTTCCDSCNGRQSMKKPNNGRLLLEDNKPILAGVHVKAASLNVLVELCISCYADAVDGRRDVDTNLPRVLFLMHKWFTTSEELANHFINLYETADKIRKCNLACRHNYSQRSTCEVYQFRLQVCQCLRYWIYMFPIHFDDDAKLAATLRDFQLHLRETGQDFLTDLVDISAVPSYDWMRKISVRTSVRKHSRKVSLVFNHLEADELADHLTYLEHKVMRRIAFQDFKKYALEGTPKDITKLERSISLFNGLSQWVQCMVLSKTTPQHRADVIGKFTNVAKRLRDLQNFNSLMAVIGGLSHSALARLSKTMACVPSEMQKSLEDMTELLSSTANFSNYRKALSESRGFRIPILGVHMKDLISLQVALPDVCDTGEMINFRKIVQLSLIFQELAEMQNSNPPIDANMDLVNTLRVSLDLVHTEDEIYELSLAREPRTSLSSSPTRTNVMFADWAAGVSVTPDPVIIEKHTHAMIEAVFKHYDHDRDGYISKEEFEEISENFPFTDSFCDLDADHDGMISKSEMKEYFLRANSPALKTSFKHDFHETTYFKPTFCAHCTGLLWGIIKQGYKCKDCGINAHKHCKDLVVMQCRSRGSSCSSRSNSFAGYDGVAAKIMSKYMRKKKVSVNDDDDAFAPPKGIEYRTCKCDQETHTIVVTEYDLSEVQVSELRNRLNRVQQSDYGGKSLSQRKNSSRTKPSSPSFFRKENADARTNNYLHPTANGSSSCYSEKHRSLST